MAAMSTSERLTSAAPRFPSRGRARPVPHLDRPLSRQIVVNDFAQAERQIRYDVLCRYDFTDWQFGHRRQRVRHQRQGTWTGPGPFDQNIFEIIFDQFTYSRRTVDMWDDLKK